MCVLIVVAWALSTWGVGLIYTWWSSHTAAGVGDGCLYILDEDPPTVHSMAPPGLLWGLSDWRWNLEWWPEYDRRYSGGKFIVQIPLWLPLLAFAIPTAWLWRRDRRPPKGYCQMCAYNLRGNESGRCPECGERT